MIHRLRNRPYKGQKNMEKEGLYCADYISDAVRSFLFLGENHIFSVNFCKNFKILLTNHKVII